MKEKIREILSQTAVKISPETFFLISLGHDEWLKLLENPELSPRMSVPFMIFRDEFETTLLLDEIDYRTLQFAVRDARREGGFRLLTFDIELDFQIVGFLSEVSRLLAQNEIPILSISSFSRDHLLIKQEYLPKALKSLGSLISEIC